MKKLILVITFVVGLVVQQSRAAEGQDISCSGYTFTLPEGWTFRNVPSQPYKVAYATEGVGAANIMFKTGQIPGTYKVWVNKIIQEIVPGLSQSFTNVRITNTQAFSTDDNLIGLKIEFEYKREDGSPVHQCFYCFQIREPASNIFGADTKAQIAQFICTTVGDDPAHASFDSIIRTFHKLNK